MTTLLLFSLTTGVLMLVLFAYFFVRGRQRIRLMQQSVLANALPAQATVLNVDRGDFTVGGAFRKLELKLTLQVQHPERPPYEVRTEWLVDEIALPQVQPKQVVAVKVNRDHPERVYPDVSWAEFSDWTLKRQ